MLTLKINYFTHLLLTSKYRAFINLLIILSIYCLFYGTKIIHCMNEEITLESLKQKIDEYRQKNEISFKTIEEQEPNRVIRQIGAIRDDIRLHSDMNESKYVDVTSSYTQPYSAQNFIVNHQHIDSTGKEIRHLIRDNRLNGFDSNGYSTFYHTDSIFFYDFREYYKEVYYPPNHPDNNFDPKAKRLLKLIERKFYEKQVPDIIQENCNIS